jgi:hypothetical protein
MALSALCFETGENALWKYSLSFKVIDWVKKANAFFFFFLEVPSIKPLTF